MKRLKIVNKERNVYTLEDLEGNNYIFTMIFLDIDKEALTSVDSIWMSEKLLDKTYDGYSTFYAFGSLDSKYGKPNIQIDDDDVIKLYLNENKVYLKRLYG